MHYRYNFFVIFMLQAVSIGIDWHTIWAYFVVNVDLNDPMNMTLTSFLISLECLQ